MLPFPLVILVIPYLPSKLPLKIFYASFLPGKRKFFRATSVFKPLCELLLNRWYVKETKSNMLSILLNKHSQINMKHFQNFQTPLKTLFL